MSTKSFDDFGITLNGRTGTEVPTTCPQCSPHRKKPKARCLSVNTDKGVWCCHHCGWTGSLKIGTDQPSHKERVIIRPEYRPLPPEGALIDWFRQRGIPHDLLDREGISLMRAYLPEAEEEVPCIAFPYYRHGEVLNIKFRGLDRKAFRQVAGAEKILYRQDAIRTDQVIITEGEVDALSVVVSGYDSVVSVPDGAPAPTSKSYTSKFGYLDQSPDPFASVARIILAVDGDEPGKTLSEELARRLGRDRCFRVTWPAACKDANDVLCIYGPDELRRRIDQAEPWPIEDVVRVQDVGEDLVELYRQGLTKGLSTGWRNVDAFYTIEPGQLTIITGIPSHGKSEWLDALSIQLAVLHGWRFGVCSPENAPLTTHLSKLTEKWAGKPFRIGPSERLSRSELTDAIQWLHEHFYFILPASTTTVPILLERATSLVRRFGIQGLILDPYNEFDHTRPKGMTETEYISDMLGLLKRWARQWGVHVWLVAHPQKLYRREDGSYPVPTPYDISGSAHWRNRADNCLTVWRDLERPDLPAEVHVQKVRFKHLGRPGLAYLRWHAMDGRYTDVVDAESNQHA